MAVVVVVVVALVSALVVEVVVVELELVVLATVGGKETPPKFILQKQSNFIKQCHRVPDSSSYFGRPSGMEDDQPCFIVKY